MEKESDTKKKSCRGAIKAVQDEIIRRALERIRLKLLVTSGKGGVGKSTVAVNLAMAFYKRGFSVGLLDVDLHGPSIPGLLGIKDRIAEIHKDQTIEPIMYREGFEVVSLESLLRDKDASVIWRGPLKANMIRQFISDVPWGNLDALVMDAPPGTGDEPLTVAQTVPDAAAVIVTTPQEISLADVRKSVRFCRQLNMQVAGIVENMSGLNCPHCGGVIDLFKSGGGERLAAMAGVPFLGRIPLDPELVLSGDEGVPLVERNPDSPTVQAYEVMLSRILEFAEEGRKKPGPDPGK
ncbi:MAG: Mrp/NBP35 family ATP-binding protein [Deltaproteobacteria bacterium]|nr:Mrp/NBP35 family ATP-binding protein [Deltaproteobacteria bacterium]